MHRIIFIDLGEYILEVSQYYSGSALILLQIVAAQLNGCRLSLLEVIRI